MRQVERLQLVEADIYALEVAEVLYPYERSDIQHRCVDCGDRLRFVFSDFPVSVRVEVLHAVGLEQRVAEGDDVRGPGNQLDVFARELVVAVGDGQRRIGAAAAAEEVFLQGGPAHGHAQISVISSSTGDGELDHFGGGLSDCINSFYLEGRLPYRSQFGGS